jgi:FeS assembly protein IscX
LRGGFRQWQLGPEGRTMKLTWKDHDEIGWALKDKFPDQDPLRLSFPKLHKMICDLEEFGDDPQGSNERLLENIQMAWYEETKP